MAELKEITCIESRVKSKGAYEKLKVTFKASSTTTKAYYRIQCKLISNDGIYEHDFLSSEDGELITAGSSYDFTIECAELQTETTYECWCYVDYKGINDTEWTSTDVSISAEFTTGIWSSTGGGVGGALKSLYTKSITNNKDYRVYGFSVRFTYSGKARFYTDIKNTPMYGYLVEDSSFLEELYNVDSKTGEPDADIISSDTSEREGFNILCDVEANQYYCIFIRTKDGKAPGTFTLYIEPPSDSVTCTVTFNHIYNDSVQKTTSATIEYGKPITLEGYAITVDGYKYDYAINSDATEVESATITEDTFFDLYYIPIKVLSKWDWHSSNGVASTTATETAYEALTSKGNIKNFSYLVWNDMVDKVKEVVDYIGQSWSNDYLTYEDTLMYENTETDDTGQTLTANRFNSLRKNIDKIELTGISEVYSKNPEYPVYGWYFTKLMQCVNTYIENNISV